MLELFIPLECEKEVGIGRPPGAAQAVAQALVAFAVTSVAIAGFATCAFMALGLYNEMSILLPHLLLDGRGVGGRDGPNGGQSSASMAWRAASVRVARSGTK